MSEHAGAGTMCNCTIVRTLCEFKKDVEAGLPHPYLFLKRLKTSHKHCVFI